MPVLYSGPFALVVRAAGHLGSDGNQFDVRAFRDMQITGLAIHVSKKHNVEVEIWSRSGSHVLQHTNEDGGWAKVLEASVMGSGRYSLTLLPRFNLPVKIPAGSLQAFSIVIKGGGIAYSRGLSKAAISVSNRDLAIYEGSYISGYHGDKIAPWFLSESARTFEGTVLYEVVRGGDKISFGMQRYVQRTGLITYITLMDRSARTQSDAEAGECSDDPSFQYTFRGAEIGCKWVSDNVVPGCGLATNGILILSRCSCACSDAELA